VSRAEPGHLEPGPHLPLVSARTPPWWRSCYDQGNKARRAALVGLRPWPLRSRHGKEAGTRSNNLAHHRGRAPPRRPAAPRRRTPKAGGAPRNQPSPAQPAGPAQHTLRLRLSESSWRSPFSTWGQAGPSRPAADRHRNRHPAPCPGRKAGWPGTRCGPRVQPPRLVTTSDTSRGQGSRMIRDPFDTGPGNCLRGQPASCLGTHDRLGRGRPATPRRARTARDLR